MPMSLPARASHPPWASWCRRRHHSMRKDDQRMRGIALALATLGAALTVVAGASATASAGKLVGTDGPGFTITLSSKSVKAGSYTITIKDKAKIHNFHLIGPGV